MGGVDFRQGRTAGSGSRAGAPTRPARSGPRTHRLIAFIATGLLVLACLGAGPAHAERRVALVVGNAAYAQPLKNPVHDATRVAEVLRKLDFDVLLETNLDKPGMEQALRRFKGLLAGADVALFYYSGHAIQSDNRNYLLPVSIGSGADLSLTLDAVALQDVSAVIRQSGIKTELLFLDACRNNPLADADATATRGVPVSRGLARVSSSLGSLIVFSTAPGAVAFDGEGELSPFTASFVHHATTPRLEIRQVLTRVRADVAGETGQKQVPWDNSSLVDDFFLVPSRPPPVVDRVATAVLPEGAGRAPLGLKAPVQPEGGPVSATVTTAPRQGTLMLGDRTLAVGDKVTAEDVARLDYASTSAAPDAFGLQITDSWGNSVASFVSLVRGGSGAPPAPAPVVDIGSGEWQGVSLVGVGPNLLITPVPDLAGPAAGAKVRLASAVPFGQFLLGDRVVETGRVIDLADLRNLSFLPPPGTAGKRLDVEFEPLAPARGRARLQVDVQVTDCDRLAGSPLDPQGVTEGVFPNVIDVKTALPACESAVKAKPQVARFQFELGRVLAASGRTGDGLAALRRAADLGYVRALQTIGFMHVVGAGVPVALEAGRAELEKAASDGDVFALQALGNLYYEGRGVPQDFDRARSLFEQSARAGHTYAMNSLGRMYLRGEGVTADPAQARRFWEEAANRGDLYGINNMGFVYLDGIAGPRDPTRALEYFRKAADLGHPEAPNNIGRLYLAGTGVPPDAAEARRWYRIGADRGDGWAAFNLATLLQQGRGGPADPEEASLYLARAAGLKNLEVAQDARRQLAAMSRKAKLGAIRQLLGIMGQALPASTGEDALRAAAAKRADGAGVGPGDGSLDAVLMALARAQWLGLGVRSDLF